MYKLFKLMSPTVVCQFDINIKHASKNKIKPEAYIHIHIGQFILLFSLK